MNWQLLPQFVVTGLLLGGPLALNALGIVLIFKSTYIFNFAQGQMLLLGALTTWWFAVVQGFPLWISIILALILSAILGFLIERFTLRPLTGQHLLVIILMTLGLSQVLQGLALLLFGSVQRNFPQIFSTTAPYKIITPFIFNDNNITIILKQNLVWSFAIAILGVLLISALFRFTRMGDHELAQSIGININRMFGISWALAGIVATTAGILLATSSGLDMSLSVVVLAAFPVVLLGGLDSIPGTIVGGLIIGVSMGIVSASKVPIVRDMAEIVPYILLLIVLLIRPEGLFGQKRIERI
jgi:branched-chain amino acid transport system permease protein